MKTYTFITDLHEELGTDKTIPKDMQKCFSCYRIWSCDNFSGLNKSKCFDCKKRGIWSIKRNNVEALNKLARYMTARRVRSKSLYATDVVTNIRYITRLRVRKIFDFNVFTPLEKKRFYEDDELLFGMIYGGRSFKKFSPLIISALTSFNLRLHEEKDKVF